MKFVAIRQYNCPDRWSVLRSGPNCNYVISIEPREEIARLRELGFIASLRDTSTPARRSPPTSPATNRRRRRRVPLRALVLRTCDGGHGRHAHEAGAAGPAAAAPGASADGAPPP